MTFSIAARCARTFRFGIAVSSSSPAVAARCAYARAGVGAAASQNITDPALGPRLLDLLDAGHSAADAMAAVIAETPNVNFRQLTVVDRNGGTAHHNGDGVLGQFATASAPYAVAAGNLLSSIDVPAAMIAAFERAPDRDIGDRLIAAMEAGLAAGGEEGPVRSAGMVIVDQAPWPVTDLRVDWADFPIAQLGSLWRLWQPQEAAYLQRALNPAQSPSYGVPGDQ
jgi:uncharacterized Ntn-hydrolase superfamily protein